MELSLLTGVQVMLSIFDGGEEKLIQYRSDNILAMQEIAKKKIEPEENYTNNDVHFHFLC